MLNNITATSVIHAEITRKHYFEAFFEQMNGLFPFIRVLEGLFVTLVSEPSYRFTMIISGVLGV